MATVSAGLIMYRLKHGGLEVLLVHPGGPYWRSRDAGAWSIPKGEICEGEGWLDAAKREFEEELGVRPEGRFMKLSPVKQKGGKVVHAWAFEGDLDAAAVKSNTFTTEWPPKSGRRVEFPEVDRAEFFALPVAAVKINPAQSAFLGELAQSLAGGPNGTGGPVSRGGRGQVTGTKG